MISLTCSPRTFRLLLLSGLIASLTLDAAVGGEGEMTAAAGPLVYVGTYSGPKSKGIYAFRLNSEDNQNPYLVPLGLAAETPNPSFLAIDPKRKLLFAVNELADFEGKPTGSVSAFSLDPVSGKLTLLNQRPSMGAGPCHLVFDKAGKHVLVANYSGGSVAVLPVGDDGRLGEATDVEQHVGRNVHDRRQGPHPHGVTLDSENKFAYVCDRGMDTVMIYRYDAVKGTLTTNDPPFATIKPGAGPRHMVFRPDGKFAYVINEVQSSVTALECDPKTGALKEVQTVSTLPGYYDGPNTTAEIDMHPSGRYLYASNRGKNSVVLFEIDQAKGTLTYVEDQSTTGRKPRHFGMDSEGKHLIIANQDSDSILVCRTDNANGRLKPSGKLSEAPSPVCVKFLENSP